MLLYLLVCISFRFFLCARLLVSHVLFYMCWFWKVRVPESIAIVCLRCLRQPPTNVWVI